MSIHLYGVTVPKIVIITNYQKRLLKRLQKEWRLPPAARIQALLEAAPLHAWDGPLGLCWSDEVCPLLWFCPTSFAVLHSCTPWGWHMPPQGSDPWYRHSSKRHNWWRISTVSPPNDTHSHALIGARRRAGGLCRIAVATTAPSAGATGNAAAMAGTAAAGGRLWAGQFRSLSAACSNTTNSVASSRWCAWPMGMPLPNGLPLGWLSTPQRCRAVHR